MANEPPAFTGGVPPVGTDDAPVIVTGGTTTGTVVGPAGVTASRLAWSNRPNFISIHRRMNGVSRAVNGRSGSFGPRLPLNASASSTPGPRHLTSLIPVFAHAAEIAFEG